MPESQELDIIQQFDTEGTHSLASEEIAYKTLYIVEMIACMSLFYHQVETGP